MSNEPTIRDHIAARTLVLFGVLAAMWFIRIIDNFLPEDFSAAGLGIVPRTWDGLSGILVAPFIHSSFGHLIANTLPFAILGALVLLNGVGEFVFVFVVSALVAGLGTWLFGAPDTQHVGASGVILGFMGFLLFRSAFDRRISSVLITLAVAAFYASALAWSFVPRESVSWTGHFFGFIGGAIAARLRHPPQRARPV
ncbi:MAG: rhomboid family intramembrane serine protease [Thermoanaerobaculia bacterium]